MDYAKPFQYDYKHYNVSYDSDMQSDFDDLRFTWYNSTSGSEQECEYWIEKNVSSSYAETRIEVPSVVAEKYNGIMKLNGNIHIFKNTK